MSIKEILYDWNGANIWIFRKINNSFSGEYYDLAMRNITMFGDKKLLPYFLAVIAAYALISLVGRWFAKKGGTKHYFLMWVGIFMVIGAGGGLALTTASHLKEHFAYQRPYALLPSDEVRHIEIKSDEEANRSFPSGHVTLITALVVALWPALSVEFCWFGAGAIFAVAWSRIALGSHFPADVLASIIISTTIVFFVRRILYALLRKIFGVYL